MPSAPMTLSWDKIPISREPRKNEIEGLDEILGIGDRYVYAIEIPKALIIQYNKGFSNICYIGRQSNRLVGNRLHGHAKGWISKFLILAQCDEPFLLHYCKPRRQNSPDSHKDVEAFLLRTFCERFGHRPLFSKRAETEIASHFIMLGTSIFNKRSSASKSVIDARRAVSLEVTEED